MYIRDGYVDVYVYASYTGLYIVVYIYTYQRVYIRSRERVYIRDGYIYAKGSIYTQQTRLEGTRRHVVVSTVDSEKSPRYSETFLPPP